MSGVIYLTIPLKLFPAVQVLEAILDGREIVEQHRHAWPFITDGKLILIRISLGLLPLAAALVLTDFGFLVAFCGAFCLGIIAFALPPVMYLLLHGRVVEGSSKMSSFSWYFHAALAALGIIVTAYTSAQVICTQFSSGR